MNLRSLILLFASLILISCSRNQKGKVSVNPDTVTTTGSTLSDSGELVSYIFGENGDPQADYINKTITLNNGSYVTVGVAMDKIFVLNDDGSIQRTIGGTGNGPYKFRLPYGISQASNDNIYITDTDNQLIKVYNKDWVFQFQFGSQGTGVGEYETLGMIKVTSDNKVYVSDQTGVNLLQYDLAGNFVAEHALEGSMVKPRDIGEDSSGNIYIADYDGSTIHKYDSSLTYITKFTGLNRPYTMTVENNLLNIGDRSNNRGIIMDTSGTVVTTLNTSTINGEANSFSRVSSVHSLANGNYFIFDIDRMAVLDSGLNVITEYQRYGDSLNPLKLNAPEDLFVFDDKVYITDYNNDKIKVTDLYGNGLMTIGSSGSGDGELNNPTDVAVASDGKIYISEWLNHRVSVFNSDGTWAFNFGTNGSGNGEFSYPCRLHVTDTKVYVSDSGNDRVQVFDLAGNYDTQFGSTGTADGQFEDPCGITVDSDGNVFVLDKSGDSRLQKFDSSHNFVVEIARNAGAADSAGDLGGPWSLTTVDDYIIVGDSGDSEIEFFDKSGNYIRTINGGWGTCELCLFSPWGVHVYNNLIYITDSKNNRLKVYNLDGTIAKVHPDLLE